MIRAHLGSNLSLLSAYYQQLIKKVNLQVLS